MGNTLGGKKTTKVMKINGEKFKFKIPVQAGSILSDHPGYVLLESESVKHYGVRAKPLEPQQELKPKRLYFLVELPKHPEESKNVRRVRSGIQMSAKDRLESLMLARRSSSDLTIMRPRAFDDGNMVILKNVADNGASAGGGGVRVRMRLPKAEVERLMSESRNGAEAAEKIVGLYMAGGDAAVNGGVAVAERDVHWDGSNEMMIKRSIKSREKRVGFLPISNGEIQVAVS